MNAERDISTINTITDRMKNYARTGKSIQRNSRNNGQSRYGANGSNYGSSPYAKASKGQSSQNMAQQSLESNGQRDLGAGEHNRSNGGADTARNTEKVKFSRNALDSQGRELY